MYEQNKQRLRAQYDVEYMICLFLQVLRNAFSIESALCCNYVFNLMN